MTQNLPAKTSQAVPASENNEENREFVTMFIMGQMFGIPVLQVQDVLGPQKTTRVPLAPREVAGSLNLRGRVVTAVDVRTRLNIPPCEDKTTQMSVVVDLNGEFYSLVVDQVGEVMSLAQSDYESVPATLDERWREVSEGVYRLKDKLLIVLNVKRLLRLDESAAA